MNDSLKILLVEDSEDDALLLIRQLRYAGYDPVFKRVDNLPDLEQALNNHSWDIITGDYAIPGFSGLAALAYLQEKGLDIPFIIVSGKIGEETAVEAMRNGAKDYILKGNLKRLVPTIERELKEVNARRRQKQAEEELVQERQRLGDIAHHSQCGLFLLDNEARIIYANKLAEEWFGTLKYLTNQYSWEVFNFNKPAECPALQAIQKQKSVYKESDFMLINGEKKFFQVNASPVIDHLGNVKQVTKVLIDITERKHAERFNNSLNTINTSILSTMHFDKIGQLAVTEAQETLECETVVLSFRQNDQWVIKYLAGYPIAPIGSRFSDNEAQAAGLCRENKARVVVNDTISDERINRTFVESLGARSYVIMPLVAKDNVVGVLSFVHRTNPRKFTKLELDYADKLSASLSLAFQNSHLFSGLVDAQSKSAIELEISNILLTTADNLAVSLDMPEILKAVGKALLQAVGRSRITINTLGSSTEELEIKYATDPRLMPGMRFTLDTFPPKLSKSLRNKKSCVVDWVRKADSVPEESKERARQFNSKVALYAPIVAGGHLIGFLSVDEPGNDKEFTEREIRLVEGIAAQAAAAIQKGRLYAEERRAKALNETLNKINLCLAGSPDFEEAIRRSVKEAAKALEADYAGIILFNNEFWIPKNLYGLSQKQIGHRFTDEQCPLSAITRKTGKPVIVEDAALERNIDYQRLTKHDVGATINIPLKLKTDFAGILFFDYQLPTNFSESQTDFALKLGASLSFAMENARLFENEHQIAETLQGALLQMPESIKGITFGHLYRSASAEIGKVGGDLYDLFELDNSKIGIIVGDVSGKGLEAAGLTAVVKNTIRAYAYQNETLDEIMVKTNEAVRKVIKATNFVTLFFGILDSRTGALAYCSAGHPSGIVRRKNALTFALSTGPPVVGIFRNAEFSVNQEMLLPGDVLLLYTDGVIEARGPVGEFFGEERLLNIVKEMEPASPKYLPRALIKEVTAFSGNKLRDDIVLLALSLSP